MVFFQHFFCLIDSMDFIDFRNYFTFIVIVNIIKKLMDKQFWVHSHKITQSGFKINNKDSMYDSALIKRMKY